MYRGLDVLLPKLPPSSPVRLELQAAVGLEGLGQETPIKNRANQSAQTGLRTVTDSLWWSSASGLQHLSVPGRMEVCSAALLVSVVADSGLPCAGELL